MTLNGTPVVFKLDTGAEVSVIGEKHLSCTRIHLNKTARRLLGAGGKELCVLGSFTGELQAGEKRVTQKVYVVRGQNRALLARDACVALGFVTLNTNVGLHVNQVCVPDAEFPSLFTGLGNVTSHEYRITLHSSATPFSVYTPRRVPLPTLSHALDGLGVGSDGSVILEE